MEEDKEADVAGGEVGSHQETLPPKLKQRLIKTAKVVRRAGLLSKGT